MAPDPYMKRAGLLGAQSIFEKQRIYSALYCT